MLQTAAQPEAGSSEPVLFETDADPDPDRLLDGISWAGRPDETRILLIGPNTLELMCALIRRGFAGVAALQKPERSEPSSADVVVLKIPQVPIIASIGRTIRQTAQTASPGGMMVITAPADAPALFLRQLTRLLVGQGLRAPHIMRIAGRTLLSAERRAASPPLFARQTARA
jgi:hypothetical protein